MCSECTRWSIHFLWCSVKFFIYDLVVKIPPVYFYRLWTEFKFYLLSIKIKDFIVLVFHWTIHAEYLMRRVLSLKNNNINTIIKLLYLDHKNLNFFRGTLFIQVFIFLFKKVFISDHNPYFSCIALESSIWILFLALLKSMGFYGRINCLKLVPVFSHLY